MALNSLFCADVPLRNYTHTLSLTRLFDAPIFSSSFISSTIRGE